MNHKTVDKLSKPILVTLIFFLIAATLGLAMRSAFVLNMPEWFDYRHIQHAHSHVALLGWLFAIFYIIVIWAFELDWGQYRKLFWGLQFAVLGMLMSFPITGYASVSILFSTVHILLSYFFVYKVWKDVSTQVHGQIPVLFLRTSLFFLALSTLGTWALGPIMAAGLKGTALYYASIQFYLHFQFNGWFIFVVLAIFFNRLYTYKVTADPRKSMIFYWILTISTLLTYALAVTWSTPQLIIFMINSIGVILQVLALVFFMRLFVNTKASLRSNLSTYTYTVLWVALLALVLKTLIQTAVVIPAMAEISYSIRNFVIGFIHLLMLGGLSLFAFGMTAEIFCRPLSPTGTKVFVLGVVTTELLLFGQGVMQWQGWGFMNYYYGMIATASIFIIVGVVLILLDLYHKTQDSID